MFLKNHLIGLGAKFLWWGLALGLVFIFCKLVVRLSKRNVYVSNLVSFCFWLLFGMIYSSLCINFYNHQFCIFGLVLMILGLIIIKISIDFFFTIFAKLLYNKLKNTKRWKLSGGKLRTSKKV